MAEIQLRASSGSESDGESPLPKQLRKDFVQGEEHSSVVQENAWENVGDQVVCVVPGCHRVAFARFGSFRKHFLMKHRRVVDVYKCPVAQCTYMSQDLWDTKKHLGTRHDERNTERWLKAEKMKNNKYTDPGILCSPPNMKKRKQERNTEEERAKKKRRDQTEEEDDRRRKEQAVEKEERQRRDQQREEEEERQRKERAMEKEEHQRRDQQREEKEESEDRDTVTPERVLYRQEGMTAGDYMMRAEEAKRLKDRYARIEADLNIKLQHFETQKWKVVYHQEREKRVKLEEKVKVLEQKVEDQAAELKKVNNPKILAIAKVLAEF
jgi:hypothetical protein